MPELAGPRGSTLFVEPSSDTPLVWITIAVHTGAANDPEGREGFWRHTFELARRGTRRRDREALDEEFDRLGASFDAFTSRDHSGFSGLCLVDNLDAYSELAAEAMAEPAFATSEHARLVRESLHYLDEIRDDDSDLAVRFFTRAVAPGYPYARSILGTEESLSRLDCAEVAAAYPAAMSADRLIIGMAGDIDEERALRVAERLTSGLASVAPPPAISLGTDEQAPTRVILVDKPKRTQSQLVLGQLGPIYGSEDYAALLPVEAAFGGMFTSRLMQEIRVKRGWSYGASFRMSKARGQYWMRMTLAPSLDQTAPALALTTELYRELAAKGIHGEELDFAKRYLSGQTVFQLDTARRRLSAAMEPALLGSPRGFVEGLPARLAALRDEQAWQATQRWVRPEQLCIVVVTSADAVRPAIEDLGLGTVDVVPFDSY